jgi:hypothetical protein
VKHLASVTAQSRTQSRSPESSIMKFDRIHSFGWNISHLFARRVFRTAAVCAAALAGAASASASDAGALNCRTTSGQATIGVRPGGTFVARVSLSSDLPLVYNSAIFRLVLTSDGVAVNDYAWRPPFETGGPTDFSLLGVDLPAVVGAETLEGPTYPAGVNDVEFANFLITGDTGPGRVVDVELQVPPKSQPGDSFFVVAVPDTFALGFVAYPIATGSVLTVRTTYTPDLTGDGVVSGADLAFILAQWGTPDADLTGDGLTTSEDLAVLLANWG